MKTKADPRDDLMKSKTFRKSRRKWLKGSAMKNQETGRKSNTHVCRRG